jgi:hypothetical protein
MDVVRKWWEGGFFLGVFAGHFRVELEKKLEESEELGERTEEF